MVLTEGKNIHFSPADNKPLCSYSNKLCRQRRLKDYGFCIRHILEDKSAPFKQCNYNTRNNSQKCLNAIPQSEERGYCHSHMQVAGIIPKTERKIKAPPSSSSSSLTSPKNGKNITHKSTKNNNNTQSSSLVVKIESDTSSPHHPSSTNINSEENGKIRKKRGKGKKNGGGGGGGGGTESGFETLKTLKILEKLRGEGLKKSVNEISHNNTQNEANSNNNKTTLLPISPTHSHSSEKSVYSSQSAQGRRAYLSELRSSFREEYHNLRVALRGREGSEEMRVQSGLRDTLLSCVTLDPWRTANILLHGEDITPTPHSSSSSNTIATPHSSSSTSTISTPHSSSSSNTTTIITPPHSTPHSSSSSSTSSNTINTITTITAPPQSIPQPITTTSSLPPPTSKKAKNSKELNGKKKLSKKEEKALLEKEFGLLSVKGKGKKRDSSGGIKEKKCSDNFKKIENGWEICEYVPPPPLPQNGLKRHRPDSKGVDKNSGNWSSSKRCKKERRSRESVDMELSSLCSTGSYLTDEVSVGVGVENENYGLLGIESWTHEFGSSVESSKRKLLSLSSELSPFQHLLSSPHFNLNSTADSSIYSYGGGGIRGGGGGILGGGGGGDLSSILHSVSSDSAHTPEELITDASFDSPYDHSTSSHQECEYGEDVDDLEKSFDIHIDAEIANQASRLIEENGFTEDDFDELFPEHHRLSSDHKLSSEILDFNSSFDANDIDYFTNMFNFRTPSGPSPLDPINLTS